MELLWTDKCFLLVVFLATFSIAFGLRREPTRLALRRVFRQPLAVGSGILLLIFLSIAILDSLHFPLSAVDKAGLNVRVESASLLDRLLFPLGYHLEKSYSAPMALRAFTSELDLSQGAVKSVFPKLSYPDPSLFAKGARQQFIYASIWQALWQSAVILVLSYIVVALLYYRYQRSWYRPQRAAALSGWISFALVLIIMFLLYALSRQLHVCGTGKIGEDILYYTVKSIRTGLVIGLLTTLIMLPLALSLGIAAGYFGGVVDDIIQYLYTTLSSIPGVLLITASVLSMQTFIANHPDYFPTLASSADARLFALCLILGVTSWTSLCRLLRAEVLKLREIDYVQAAIALGSRSTYIILRHLLPNVMHIVLITLVLDFSFLVLAEAVLSYVGVGVSPMTISWGNMINGARLELAREPVVWWPMLAAFLFMFTLVLCGNLFADAVRDAFDPHHSHR